MATTFKTLENNAKGTLSAAIVAADVTCDLQAGEGAEFPSSGTFWVTLFGSSVDTNEVVLCTSRSTDELTITRAQQGTAAADWPENTNVQLLWTKSNSTDITGAISTLETTGAMDALAVSGDGTIDGAVTFNDSGADKDFRVEGVGVANALFVEGSSGKVGIGTATPDSKLHVESVNGGASNSLTIESTTATSNYVGSKLLKATGAHSFWTAIDNTTGAAFSTGLAHAGVLWRNGNYPICLATNSVNRLTVLGDGNVGIGTATPSSELDVVGDAEISGTLDVGGILTAADEIVANNIHNNAGTGSTGAVASGTWTPAGTNVANCATITESVGYWQRVGQVVTFGVKVIVDVTAATTFTDFTLDLPVASTIADVADVCGSANFNQGSVVYPGVVLGQVANDKMTIQFVSVNDSTHVLHIQGTYIRK